MEHRIVSREEWLAARKTHLADEKELTRRRDALSLWYNSAVPSAAPARSASAAATRTVTSSNRCRVR